MPTYVPGSNPYSSGDDFPSTSSSTTLPGGVTAVVCDYPHAVDVAFKNIVHESWDGSEKRSSQGAARLRFKLRFEQLTPTDGDTLWNHYLAQSGDLHSFSYFDYLSDEEISVRYASKAMSRSTFIFEAEKVGIELVQVL